MSYKGLAQALAQIGADYGRNADEQRKYERASADEQRLYERGRADKVDDDKSREESALRVAQAQADISFAQWKKQNLEARREIARTLGIDNADSLSDNELATRVEDAMDKKKARAAKTEATAKYEAEQDIEGKKRNNPNFATNAAKDQENRLTANAAQIDAAKSEVAAATAQLDALKANDAKLAGMPLTIADLASQKAAAFLATLEALPPSQRNAQLLAAAPMMANAKTPEQARAAIIADPVGWATAAGRVSKDDIANIERRNMAMLQSAGYGERTEITALLQRINSNSAFLVTMGVKPTSVVTPTPGTLAPVTAAPAPAGAAPAGAVARVPGSAVAPSGPATWLPETSPAPQSSAVPTPAADGFKPWWSVQGVAQRAAPAAQSLGRNVASMPNNLDRGATAIGKGLWSGDYSVPETGVVGQALKPVIDANRAAANHFFSPAASAAPAAGQFKTTDEVARGWLASTGVRLDPKVESLLMSQFQTVIASSLSPDEKAARVKELQQAAMDQDLRPRIQSTASPAPSSYWGPR